MASWPGRGQPGRQGGHGLGVWLVPESMHDPIRQDVVLLKAGQSNPAARALLDYLRGDTARAR